MERMNLLGNYTILTIGALMLIVFCTTYAPTLVVYVLILLLSCVVFLEAIKFIMWIGFKQKDLGNSLNERPMVSVHLAIHNEPPSLVIDTIKSILSQKYKDYELLVVDNNTKDREIWEPVEKFCEGISGVRFFHLYNWPFYKSGALNFARKVTSNYAKYIFVIDADYIMHKTALCKAVSSITDNNIALVQFPQAYQSNDKSHRPILQEFRHFFDYYCFKANSCYGALATGTLSLIKISALDKVGGWPVNSITEDAELGSRLQSAGYDIKFDNQVIGKGIAPIDQFDFYQQRKRWIFGNVQTLFGYSVNPLRHFKKWISGVAQLTAWANLLGIPILCLLSCVLFGALFESTHLNLILSLSYLSLWVFTLSKIIQMILIHRKDFLLALKTFLVHFSSLSIGAFHWWPVVFRQQRPFVKTNKIHKKSNYEINFFYPFLHLVLIITTFPSANTFLITSASIFLVLHVLSILVDCKSRNKHFKNLSTSLKLIS